MKDMPPEIRITYYIIQQSRYLSVYARKRDKPTKRILKYDMQSAKDRQGFIYVRSHAARQCPPPPPSPKIIRKDLLKVHEAHRGSKKRRQQKEERRIRNPMADMDCNVGNGG